MSRVSDAARRLLIDAGTSVVCMDVGGAGGLHPKMQALGDRARAYSFDADKNECERLNADPAQKVTTLHAAVGRQGESVLFHLARQRESSSCHPFDMVRCCHYEGVELNRERFVEDGTVPFTTRSLDAICSEQGLPAVDFLKVDAEGHELTILEGMSNPPLMCEVEVLFHAIRAEAPLFDEVMSHMRRKGHMLLDLRRVYWNPDGRLRLPNYAAKGALIMGDALFVVDPFQSRNMETLTRRDARFKLYALLTLYGYGAVVLLVVEHLTSIGVVDTVERDAIERHMRSAFSRPRRAPRWLGRVVHRGLSVLERFVEMPVAIADGFSRAPDYQGDGMLGDRQR